MIKEGKRLYELGYAIHWLKPNSKQPIESGWTTGPRKTWAELEDSYKYGNNLGVRLGRASKFPDGTYLAVIDCDVKSSDPKHEAEMEAKLKELLGVSAPSVMSGRGNGSKHFHVKTREPIAPYRFGQSTGKVKVHMPSAKPSKHEQATLSKDELESGIRIRTPWEISVMGEGNQVVLPPSTHPDTGEAYEWGRMLTRHEDLPLVELGSGKLSREKEDKTPFKAVSVDVVSSPISDEVLKLISTGQGSSGDRSADLMTATIALLKAGHTDDEILSLLTERGSFLGETGYEHAQTSSRSRAAEWVRRYTLAKAKKSTLAEFQFQTEVNVTTLSEHEAAKQARDVLPEKSWLERLERTQTENGPGRIKPTQANLELILDNVVGPALFRHNEFSSIDIYGLAPPWNDAKPGQEVRDIDLINILHWVARKFKVEFTLDRIHSTLKEIAIRNKFHPVKDYLSAIEWDGVERIDSWLETYAGAKGDKEYLAAVGRKTLCAMIARIYEPGCKFDHVLILEGAQGAGKSSIVRILSSPWFSDSHLDISNKDAVVEMRDVWVREIGELAGMSKADVNALKSFISSAVDRIRVPYGRVAERFPRQCIFIGTTNNDEYLRDASGNRRFWPVEVGKCDLKALKRDRDQLLAEARFMYGLGEPLWLEDTKVSEVAERVQLEKSVHDTLTEELRDFLENVPENDTVFSGQVFRLVDLFSDFAGGGKWSYLGRQGVVGQMRMAESLKKLGYRKYRGERKGVRAIYWTKA